MELMNPEDLQNLSIFPARCELSMQQIEELSPEEYSEFLSNCVEFDL